MASQQLILTQDVEHLGQAGELVTVKPGYARNYLLPQGMAVTANSRNRAKLEHDKATIERRVAKQRAEAGSIAERLNAMTPDSIALVDLTQLGALPLKQHVKVKRISGSTPLFEREVTAPARVERGEHHDARAWAAVWIALIKGAHRLCVSDLAFAARGAPL